MKFITYDQAIALKKLKFNTEVFSYYSCDNKEEVFFLVDPDDHTLTFMNHNAIDHNNLQHIYLTSAPTYAQAFEWLRDSYNLSGIPDDESYCVWILNKCDKGEYLSRECLREEYPIDGYDKAESLCLDKLIEFANANYNY